MLEGDITKALNNPQTIADIFNVYGDEDEQKQKYGYTASTVIKAQNNKNGLGIGLLKAFNYKEDIQNFVNLIAPAVGEISEEVYYK